MTLLDPWKTWIFKEIRESCLRKKIYEKISLKIKKKGMTDTICYYPGFYSSLRDEMGANGDHLKKLDFLNFQLKNIDKFDL